MALAGLVVLFAARLVHTAAATSFTVDEPHYVGTGRYLWQTGDYHWYHTLLLQPPLAYHLASLPLLALDPGDLKLERMPGWNLVRRAQTPLRALRVASRLPFVLLACWGAVLVFLWAAEIAGSWAGVLAAFLFTFTPVVAAYAPLAHSDMAVSVFYLQTLYTFWRWWRSPSPPRLALCGLSLGLALAAKMNAVLLLPTLAVMTAVLVWRPGDGVTGSGSRAARGLECGGEDARDAEARRQGFARGVGPSFRPGRGFDFGLGLGSAVASLAAIGAAALLVLWLAYGGSFRIAAETTGPFPGVPLPGYVHALLVDQIVNERGDRTFWFFGRLGGPAWYFLPVGFALKTPLAVPLLALGAAVRRRVAPVQAARLGLFLGIPALLYATVACFVLRVPAGVRFLLPLYPLLCVFTAARLSDLSARWQRIATVVCCTWLAVASLTIHPHYLAYFNEAIGGPRRAHRYFADSNLDWGQDLASLARWLAERGNPPVRAALFSAERPEAYGIVAQPLDGCAPVHGGLVAISASVLHGLHDPANYLQRPPPGCYDWLGAYEPIATPGYSILVYDLGAPAR
jgi:hypothetical protein